jgi:hypothetical protein
MTQTLTLTAGRATALKVRNLDKAIVDAQAYRARVYTKNRYVREDAARFGTENADVLHDYTLSKRGYRFYINELRNAPALPLP